MLILAVDSSGSFCGACVWRDGRVLARARDAMQRGQDARLMPMIVEVMRQAGCAFSDLDRIGVTTGPGSFTGVRVGLAAARGIGIAAGRPVVGMDRFSVYRDLYADAGKDLLVEIDSKRAELFCRFFPAAGGAGEPCMMTREEIQAFLAEHSGTVRVGDLATPDDDALPVLARLAAGATVGAAAFLPRPLYLRAPDVTMPKKA